MDNCWEKIGTRNHPTNYGVHRRFGTDKSVPYAHAGKCTIQHTAQKSLPIGTHKCVPYENSVNAPLADYGAGFSDSLLIQSTLPSGAGIS